MDDFQRQQSVWNLVKENVPYYELPEIRTKIGDTLIDIHTELYSEVEMWKKIWQEILDSKQGSRPETPVFPLADPPAIKELLKAEIQLLLLTLRKRAARHGRDAEEFMAHYNPSVVSYSLGSITTQRQKSTESCSETRKSPSRPPSSLSEIGSRSFSRLSSHEEEIKALSHKLNVTHIDEVVSHLRSVLSKECEAMKRDVQVLQEKIETERFSCQRGPVSPEPTVAELKEERRIIQRDLKVQSLMSCSRTTNNLTRRNSQVHLRESKDSSANDLERIQQSSQIGLNSKLKPCPPRDTEHPLRTDRDRMTPSVLSSSHNDITPKNDNTLNTELNSTSARASAFRLIPAVSVGVSGSTKTFIKLQASEDDELRHLQPVPPAMQKSSSRGQRGRRYPCVTHPDSVASEI